MRQAILLGARPLFLRGKSSPTVPLGAGQWRIDVENVVGTKLRLTTIHKQGSPTGGTFGVPSVTELNGGIVLVNGPATVSVEIVEAGREDYINVFAVSMNGN